LRDVPGRSNEVVAYDSATHAAAALTEWRAAAARHRAGRDLPQLGIPLRPATTATTNQLAQITGQRLVALT
jgi:hypothetical protein